MIKMTAEEIAAHILADPGKRQRVQTALADTLRYIAKEEPRRADLRPPEVAELLASYKAHAEKLRAALALAAVAA